MRLLISALLVLTFTLAQAQSPDVIAAYIEQYKTVAIKEMKTYGIPASITLAQGIHESSSGRSPLAINANNHFGIKCHDGWTGKTYYHDDDKPQECFRVYNCAEESFRDHSEFLKTRSRYANLFALQPDDYRGWARGLKADGYATNPKYPDIIIKLIEDYNLTQYDNPNGQLAAAKRPAKDTAVIEAIKQSLAQSSPSPMPDKTPEVKANKPKTEHPKHPDETQVAKRSGPKSEPAPAPALPLDTKEKITAPDVPKIAEEKQVPKKPELKSKSAPVKTEVAKTKTPDLDLSKYTFTEKTVNGTLSVVYQKDLPLTAIAQNYSITIDQLYTYNDMTANTKLKDNDLVYVESKKPESFYYQYEVSAGETMWDVSQKFGVQLSELIKRNGITPGSEPQTGEVIVLRGKREFPLKVRTTGKPANPPKTSIESSPKDGKVHKVGYSETLYSISKQYNIPLDTLKKINGLKDKDIKIGQTLIVSL